ncbi:glycoside hydrolase superfamily [Crepidotus variabilis]|uniref:Alpha-amylase n=1 Tax=Crepidotus variabilis TaxID=179855 RepID=A0A9P6E8K1_9AGAR|nr:glycoside hydrolase superfamily [Crepidotus variabilis]
MHIAQTLLLLSLPVLALSNVLPPGTPGIDTQNDRLNDGKSVIALLFQWSWDSIAAECTNFLGPNGYQAVLTSPPMEHVAAEGWFNDYSVVTYNLTSRHGSRDQFQNMIHTCHAAGLERLLDVILNHMTDQSAGGIGFAGSAYSHYDHAGLYQTTDFHHCGLETDDEIVYYTDNSTRTEIQNCELFNHADLRTDTEYVRTRLAEYLNDLISLGLDGFRLDAARHIPQKDLKNILSRMTSKPYITQQTIFGSPVQPEEYLPNGQFRYTTALQEAFLAKGISELRDMENKGWVPGSQANVFVADHDTERNNHSLSYQSPNHTYFLASYFLLAYPYGRPTILSGYAFSFSMTGAGSPNGGVGTCNGTNGVNGWLCQHRYTGITGMVGFRNSVGNTALTDWVAPSSQQIAFGRGSRGFIAINNGDSDWTTMFKTSMRDGVYCNVIDGAKRSDNTCTGSSFTITQGRFSASVPARRAIAIHVGTVVQ